MGEAPDWSPDDVSSDVDGDEVCIHTQMCVCVCVHTRTHTSVSVLAAVIYTFIY
jgi:hypothetical protein